MTETRPPSKAKHGCLKLWLVILFLSIACPTWWIATSISSLPAPGQPLFSPTVEANFVTGPPNENADVDYPEYINQQASVGVTAENNVVVKLVACKQLARISNLANEILAARSKTRSTRFNLANASPKEILFMNYLLPVRYGRWVFINCIKSPANLQILKLTIALRLFRYQHQTYSETLAELGSNGWEIPRDPLSAGGEFVYRRTEQGFRCIRPARTRLTTVAPTNLNLPTPTKTRTGGYSMNRP